MATSTPTTKEGWLALAQHYRDNATDYEGYPHDSWEYSQYTYWIGQAEYAEEQAAKFNMGGGGSSDPKLITGTSGDDSIVNRIAGAIIQALGGNDKIENSGASVSIDGGAGTDTIDNNADYVTIIGGAGDDKISNYSLGMLYIYNNGDGNDTIWGINDNDTILIPCGDWVLSTVESDAVIKVGEGKITLKYVASLSAVNIVSLTSDIHPINIVFNDKSGTLIKGKSYLDLITNYGSKVTIKAGDGGDTIKNGDWTVIGGSYVNSKWEIRAGSKTSIFSGANVSIDGGKGSDYIDNVGDNVSISGSEGNDEIENYGSKVLISGGKGNDVIENRLLYPDYYKLTADLILAPDNSTLLGGDGNDYIRNEGSNVKIDGGAGDDRIENESYNYSNWRDIINLENITVDGGDGNDTIFGYGKNVIVNGGAGNDSIDSADTIYGGDGNDCISGGVYVDGGTGDDSIESGYEDSTIFGGDGDDTILLVGYTRSDNYSCYVTINGGSGNDLVCAKKGAVSVSINGGDGNDTISCPYAKDSTILGGVGNDLISIASGKNNLIQYANGDGNDTIYGFNADDSIQLLTDSKITANMTGNDVIFKIGDTAEAITVKDVLNSGSAQIKVLSKTGELSIYKFNKNTGVITNESDSITLTSPFSGTFDASNYTNVDASTADNKITLTSGKTNSVTLIGGTADDSIQNFTANSSLFGGAGNDTITNKTSYNETVTRQITETVRVQEPTGYYEDVPVTIKASARLPEIDKEIKEIKASIQDHLDKAAKYEDWARDGNAEWWLGQRDNETLAADNLKGILKDYQADYDAMLSKMLADGDYTLTTGETEKKFHQTGTKWVDKVETKNITETLTHQTNNIGTTIYGGTGDDYVTNEAADFVYNYTVGDGNDTIEGFNEASKVRISGGDYTASASGNDVILKVGDGSITLKDTKGKVLNINGKKTFKKAWTLDDPTAIYGTGIETLITVNGVKSLDGISLSGTKVTLSEAALGTDKVTVSDGYTLALGTDVTKSSKTKAWSLSKTTATYKQTTTAGYTLADNAITYSPKSIETLATVKGVKAVDGLKVSGKTITVSEASLNKKNVTVSDGYTLKLGSDVTKPITKKAAWNLSGSTATYKSSYKTAGYTLADNQISYAKATTATNLATVKGAKSADGLSVSGSKITLKNAALANKVTVSGGYEFDFAKDYTNATITGSKNNDTITARGTKVLINAGAGDDTIKMLGSTITVKGGSGNDLFVYSTGNNVIADYETGDKISIGSAISSSSFKDTDATFKIGSKTLTVKNGKGKEITFIDASGTERTIIGGAYLATNNTSSKVTIAASREVGDATARTNPIRLTGNAKDNTILGGSNDDSLYGGAGNDSLIGNAGNDLLSGGSGDDYVIGGDGNDKLYGYTGNDTLIGGAGNDSLWGQTGADTFVYADGDGNDIIYGFDDNDMLTLDGLDFTASVENDAVKFTVNDGSIILKDFTATTFHVNGDTYAISNNKFVKQ